MPGVSPPQNFPSPPNLPGSSGGETGIGVGASASFVAGPPVLALCGFALPLPAFLLGLKIKIPRFPPPLPIPFLSIGLKCSLSNPFDVSAGVAYGGGRVATFDPNPDDNAV